MLEIIKAIIYGIVEGITEWLPISSTGHLILLNQFVKLDVSEEFYSMFEDCTGISELDVSNFRFSSATSMNNLFAKNYNLRSIRMDMRDIPANCTLSKVVYGVMTVGTMFCKDNVQDSRITESLPKDWTISSF